MDEAGRSTQPPLIMAPPVPKADPDGKAQDTVVDNGIMAPSRTRTGTSHSGAIQRPNGASGSNGKGTSGNLSGTASTETEALPVVKDTAQAEPATVAPLPADVIGRGKARPASEKTTRDEGAGWQGSRYTMTSGESTDSAAPATVAEDDNPAAKNDPEPSFGRSETPATAPTTSYLGSSDWTPRYTRSEWSTEPATTTATPAGSAGPASGTAPASPPPPAAGSSSSRNGYSPGNGFSSGTVGSTVGSVASGAASVASGAASAATGAAAGLASSVSAAWQRRGSTSSGPSPQRVRARKASKRQAMLTLSRVEPWSVMKFSFVASVVAFVILFVAVAVLYMVLAALGVFDSLQHTVSTMTSSQGSAGTNISHWFSASLILGYTAMLGALNIVLITAMSTVGSVIYNLIAKTIGGIEVTLRETD